jgi:hypothetical protein
MTVSSGSCTGPTAPDILSAMLPPGLLSGSPFGNSTKDLVGAASSHILRIIAFYMVSNGLVKPQYEHAKAILEWIQPLRNRSMFKRSFKQKDPTSRATLMNIFLYAVLAGNVAVLKALPTSTYSYILNEPHTWFSVSDPEYTAHTALDYACIQQNRDLYFLLAGVGATNLISLPDILGIIQIMKVRNHQGSGPLGRIQVDMDIISTMLENGITICRCSQPSHSFSSQTSAFGIAFTWDNLELMELLLRPRLPKHTCLSGFDWIQRLGSFELSCSSAMIALLVDAEIKMPVEIAIRSKSTKGLQRILEAGSKFEPTDLDLICQQDDFDFIADAFELYVWHNTATGQGNPSLLPVAEWLDSSCKHFGHPGSSTPDEDINSSRPRKIHSLISSILSLPVRRSGIYLDRCLESALRSGCEYSVRQLIRAGGHTTHVAVSRANDNNLGVMSALLCNAWSPSYNSGKDHFKLAIETGDPVALREAIDAGYDVNYYQHSSGNPERSISPLGRAIRSRQPTIVSLLLERGADASGHVSFDLYHPRRVIISPLAFAIKTRNATLVQHLINIGADLGDEFALCVAVTTGHDMVRRLLVARSSKVWHRKPKFAFPALQLAIIRKDIPIIRSLLEHRATVHEMWTYSPFPEGGADGAMLPDIIRVGETAIETAIIEDRDEDLPILRLILLAWQNLNSPWVGPAWKRTCPLSLAVKHANHHIIHLLLARGADLNANIQNNQIGSPLQIASEMGDINLVQNFIALGANVNATAPNSLLPSSTSIRGKEWVLRYCSAAIRRRSRR